MSVTSQSRSVLGRTPHGVRGLKYHILCNVCSEIMSHPSRGAWIEMLLKSPSRTSFMSHPSRGAWIEICGCTVSADMKKGRTPHGVRGLKYDVLRLCAVYAMSHPSRGAWIEIYR